MKFLLLSEFNLILATAFNKRNWSSRIPLSHLLQSTLPRQTGRTWYSANGAARLDRSPLYKWSKVSASTIYYLSETRFFFLLLIVLAISCIEIRSYVISNRKYF